MSTKLTQKLNQLRMYVMMFLSVAILSSGCGGGFDPKMIDDDHGQSSGTEFSSSSNLTSNATVIHSPDGWLDVVKVYVAADAPQIVADGLQKAVQSWNDAVGKSILIYQGKLDAEPEKSLYDGLQDTNTIVYFDSEWRVTTSKSSSVIATTIWQNFADKESAIERGDVILNAENYEFTDALNSEQSVPDSQLNLIVDAESILVHEIGHLIGLNHVSEDLDPKSVMNAQSTIGAGSSKRELSDVDISFIRQIYAK